MILYVGKMYKELVKRVLPIIVLMSYNYANRIISEIIIYIIRCECR